MYLTWLARNLEFAAPDSFCYEDRPSRCDEYGRSYRWETALAACPPGWHLSTELEWQAPERFLGLPADQPEGEGNRGSDQGRRLKAGGDTRFDVQDGG